MSKKMINTKELREQGYYEGFIYTLYDETGKRIEQDVPVRLIRSLRD